MTAFDFSSVQFSHSVMPDSLRPHGLTRGIFQARILQWVAFPFSRGSSQPGVEPRSPTLQADSLPAEPPGKPKNIGVDSLSLPGDLPNPGTELGSLALQVDSLPAELPGSFFW